MNARFRRKFFAWFAMLALVMGVLAAGPTTFAAGKKMKKLSVSSTAFKNGGDIAPKYAYNAFDIPGAENLSIPLEWKVPKKVAVKTKSFAVTIIDLHPIAEKFVHLLAYNIPANARGLEEGAFSGDMAKAPPGSITAMTNAGFVGYVGPYPPPNEGKHVYEITVYALNVKKLELDPLQQTSEAAFKKLLKGKIVAKGKLKGKFGYENGGNARKPEGTEMKMEADIVMPNIKMVEITSTGFSPNSVTIKIGDQITFVNKDTETHWPASDPHPVHTAYPERGGCIASLFDACRALGNEDMFGMVLNHAGKWTYHDHLNPSLTGTVIVE